MRHADVAAERTGEARQQCAVGAHSSESVHGRSRATHAPGLSRSRAITSPAKAAAQAAQPRGGELKALARLVTPNALDRRFQWKEGEQHPSAYGAHVPAGASGDYNARVQARLKQMALAATVDESSLSFVRRLGEGAFAIVDLCKYTGDGLLPLAAAPAAADPHGRPPADAPRPRAGGVLVAVKKMKTHLPMVVNAYSSVEPELVPVPEKWVTNFQSEGVLLRTLRHPNVVGCYGSTAVVLPDGRKSLHFVLEYMPGGTLRERIIAADYDATTALGWLLGVARGLEYLHHHAAGARLAHRDLKPENIMLSADGTAKIGDFGLCKVDMEEGIVRELGDDDAAARPDAHATHAALFRRSQSVTTCSVNGGDGWRHGPGGAKDGSALGGGRAAARQGTADGAGKARSGFAKRGSWDPRGLGRLKVDTSDDDVGGSGSGRRGSTAPSVERERAPHARRERRETVQQRIMLGATRVLGAVYAPKEMTGMTGSALFMAPENYLQMPYSGKVDVFSFGIILVEVLARRRAYAGLFLLPDQVAHAVAHKGLRPQLPAHWPAELQHLARACWDKSPDARPSPREVVAQLSSFALAARADPDLLRPLERQRLGGCLGALFAPKPKRAPDAAMRTATVTPLST